ncbi:MAG: hypothetical protein AB1568_12370 [Thermodesulfobacteriota bacterium]
MGGAKLGTSAVSSTGGAHPDGRNADADWIVTLRSRMTPRLLCVLLNGYRKSKSWRTT